MTMNVINVESYLAYLDGLDEGKPFPNASYFPDDDFDCDMYVDIENTDGFLSTPILARLSEGEKEEMLTDAVLDNSWFRIPINGVEQWINKDGPAAINRTTKVVAFNNLTLNRGNVSSSIPNTLDEYFESKLTNASNTSGFPKARVYIYDESADEYVVTQQGYIGGYGATDNGLLRKFWIYDPVDLLRDIPVGATFTDPTVGQLINFVIGGTDDTGNDVGITEKTPFEYVSVDFPSSDQLSSRTAGQLLGEDESIDGILDFAEEFAIQLVRGEQLADRIRGPANRSKSFQRNRNNLVDVLNYIGKLIDGIWYIEPQENSLTLRFRADWSENNYGREFVDQTQDATDDQFTVQVAENTALSDIKPINTVAVNGETKSRLEKFIEDPSRTALEVDGMGEIYPYAKVRYDPFYQAAGEQELGPTNVRGEATDLRGAEKEAYSEFIEHIEESTEGRIELFGDPAPLPYDYLRSVPSCLGNLADTRRPLPYSINDVHHKKYAGEKFMTELGVHARVENTEENFTYVSEYRQAQ